MVVMMNPTDIAKKRFDNYLICGSTFINELNTISIFDTQLLIENIDSTE